MPIIKLNYVLKVRNTDLVSPVSICYKEDTLNRRISSGIDKTGRYFIKYEIK